ncbi:MAG: altronate dehydratase family protein [Cytophagales bacterium]|nr:altronate dehydratase family protein [Bernardetiaceae bacterium]MDW8204463.1 altronate dehydratase family protein [Cytophagales bacterium]
MNIAEKKLFLQLHPQDNVLVALQDLPKGTAIELNGHKFVLAENIPAKHKFTIAPLKVGDEVRMYGVLVGKITRDVPQGGWIHTGNLKHAAQSFSKRQGKYHWQAPDVSRWQHRTFKGYWRSDGQVGVRNYWLVIPLVFCENRDVLVLKDAFLNELGYAQPDVYREKLRTLIQYYKQHGHVEGFQFPEKAVDYAQNRLLKNVDGIKFLTHESGCGGTREDANNLCALLAGYCINPNVAGITVLSLGCQHSQFEILQQKIRERSPHFDKPLLFFERQQWHSEQEMLSAAMLATFKGLLQINTYERAEAPLSKLCIGVKCGGSDGFSGISANPAVGHCADLIAALGGRVLMAEFPELCGVEQELINRAVSDEVADNFIYLMREYARRAEAVGAGFDMNPSPGNIKDGLITDAIKSAGAAKKGGTSPIVDALGYGGYATKNGGLTLVCTPGNDVEATTGMAGAGATIQLFTTGLGTATGNPISPMVKLSTNNALAERMSDIIDINCGGIITGEKTVEQMGEEILEYIIGLASGEYDTAAMRLGQDDFIFWKRGVSL